MRRASFADVALPRGASDSGEELAARVFRVTAQLDGLLRGDVLLEAGIGGEGEEIDELTRAGDRPDRRVPPSRHPRREHGQGDQPQEDAPADQHDRAQARVRHGDPAGTGEVLRVAAGLERSSEHPLARAVMAAANAEVHQIEDPLPGEEEEGRATLQCFFQLAFRPGLNEAVGLDAAPVSTRYS